MVTVATEDAAGDAEVKVLVLAEFRFYEVLF